MSGAGGKSGDASPRTASRRGRRSGAVLWWAGQPPASPLPARLSPGPAAGAPPLSSEAGAWLCQELFLAGGRGGAAGKVPGASVGCVRAAEGSRHALVMLTFQKKKKEND